MAMVNAVIVKGGKVVNRVVASSENALENGWVITDEGQIGDTYANGVFTKPAPEPLSPEAQRREDQLAGVLFEGVMCSATAEDMWGLNSVKDFVAAGNTVNFEFENNNVLELTPLNYAAFEAVWTPFRASFF